jgi:hypothetical protein
MTLSKHALFLATATAKGTTVAKRTFGDRAAAEKFLAGWRKAGARTTVSVLTPPPAPVLAGVTAEIAGPDALWGGWNTPETNDALDALDA